MAVSDCLGEPIALPLTQVPLLVGLAEPKRPGGGAASASTIVAQVQDRLGVRFHRGLSGAIPRVIWRALKRFESRGICYSIQRLKGVWSAASIPTSMQALSNG